MRNAGLGFLLAVALAAPALAEVPEGGGPHNVRVAAGDAGRTLPLTGADALVAEGASYTVSGWIRPESLAGMTVMFALGDANRHCRCVALFQGHPMVIDGPTTITAKKPVKAKGWTHVAAVFDGSKLRLYVGGMLAGEAAASPRSVPATLQLAPQVRDFGPFSGSLVAVTVDDTAASAASIKAIAAAPPDFAGITEWLE